MGIKICKANSFNNYTLNIDYEEIYNDSFAVVNKFHSFVKEDNID